MLFSRLYESRHVSSLTKYLSLQKSGVPGILWVQIDMEQVVSHGPSYLLTLILCPWEQLSPFCHDKVPARTQKCQQEGYCSCTQSSLISPTCTAGEVALAKCRVPDCAWTPDWFGDTKSNCAVSVTEERLREALPDSNIKNIIHLNKQ